MGIGDHPAIANALLTGYPNGDPKWPHCPVCGAECEKIYMNEDGDIFACDECVQTKCAWETSECF